MAYDPKKDLIQMPGKNGQMNDYLEVKFRLIWLRDLHPNWGVETELLQLDAAAIVKASIKDETGRVIATGHGMAKTGGNAKWAGREIEKAETAAIGRALAHAGIGTQFIDDETEGEGDHLADSPVERKPGKSNNKRTTTPATSPVAFDATSGPAFVKWAGEQFADLSPAGLNDALKHQVPALEFIQQWPFSVNEAIAAIFAYQAGYDRAVLNDWFTNLKKVKALKNSRGKFFTDALLDTFRDMALKLAKGA